LGRSGCDLNKANAITLAPLVVKNKVIVGVAGGDFSSRAISTPMMQIPASAYAVSNTVPFAASPAAIVPNAEGCRAPVAGAAWVTGSYDPALNLVYYGTGNRIPIITETIAGRQPLHVLAFGLDGDTGKLPVVFPIQLPTMCTTGTRSMCPCRPISRSMDSLGKSIMVANRNGFFYTLDANPESYWCEPFIDHPNWAKEVDAGGGRSSSTILELPKSAFRQSWWHRLPTADVRSGAEIILRDSSRTCAIWEPRNRRNGSNWACAFPAGGRQLMEGFQQSAPCGQLTDHGPACLEHRIGLIRLRVA